ncbi:hypothetical protein dsmv_0448 [Desulfococcus multivorans DSM 2059]|uniref:Uncharacterized protein n=1 Tax=Desulfococcus multivorans DSM 2059 TaxID=1121405 RepID=S7V306_DESML|nr:hypothetical protein dsmv_0448 [Desulfococcus multivorans DSM 2059]SJZ64543.1 hypothetical protein SAMN02745446_01203 [Desulfococcus multivorans DSM 2059]
MEARPCRNKKSRKHLPRLSLKPLTALSHRLDVCVSNVASTVVSRHHVVCRHPRHCRCVMLNPFLYKLYILDVDHYPSHSHLSSPELLPTDVVGLLQGAPFNAAISLKSVS